MLPDICDVNQYETYSSRAHRLIYRYKVQNKDVESVKQAIVRTSRSSGSAVLTITQQDLRRKERRLNNRPRKALDMKKPSKVAFGLEPTGGLGI